MFNEQQNLNGVEILLLAIESIALQLGPIHIHWYGIIIGFGVIMAYILSEREGKRRGIPADYFSSIVIWLLPIGILGARLYYVLFRWSYYSAHLGEILQIWNGGLAIYGGLIAGGLTLLIYNRLHWYSSWTFLDILAPGVLLAQAIGRWGNFMNQEAYGPKTTLSFLQSLHLPDFIIKNMFIAGAYHQPTFLYESLWSLAGVILILVLRHRKNLFKNGEIFLTYIMWYSMGRFFIEGLRMDSLYLTGNLRVSQLLSVLLFIVAAHLVFFRRIKKQGTWYLEHQSVNLL